MDIPKLINVPDIKKISTGKIIVDKSNPNTMSDKQFQALKRNIERYGFLMPVITNKDYKIADGFHRWKAARELGITEVPVIALDIDEIDRRMLRQILNKLRGEHDIEMDAVEYQFIIEQGQGELFEELSTIGVDELNAAMGTQEVQEDEFVVNVEEPKYNIEKGDVYVLGNHRLMCGDSTDKEDVDKLMDGKKADMVFTDPPYGINLEGDNSKRGKDTSLMKGGLKLHSFKDDTIDYAVKAFNIVQDMDVKYQVWFGANYYAHHIPQTNNWLVWDKRVEEKMTNTNSDCELAWVLDGHSSVRIFRHLWNGLVKASEHGQRRVHPTQKPIALAEHCFNRYNPEGKSVLDLFGGSGSTLIACEQLNRKCYMMELDTKYCSVIIERWEALTGEVAVKVGK